MCILFLRDICDIIKRYVMHVFQRAKLIANFLRSKNCDHIFLKTNILLCLQKSFHLNIYLDRTYFNKRLMYLKLILNRLVEIERYS